MQDQYPVVQIRSGRDKPLDWGHPWVFSGAVQKVGAGASDGSLVAVHDSKGKSRGVALYGSKTIALKFLSRRPRAIDAGFFLERFNDAFALRRRAGLFSNPELNSFRLFYAESDGVPGLIIDRYSDTAVVQIQEPGLLPFAELISSELVAASGGIIASVYLKNREEGGRYLCGPIEKAASETVIVENGAKFPVDWERGQKTGFFLDQRDNRALLRKHSAGASVLNCFSYTGGFSINAGLGGAERVVSVESSEWALEMLRRGREMNPSPAKYEEVRADCFDFLTELREEFDVIVLDPPAFVKHRSAFDQGLRGYQQINALGLKAVKRGGLLFTFSCSQLISRDQFRKTVFEAALTAGRRVRILHELTQAACHPVQLFFPESEYLKGYVLYVDQDERGSK